MYVCMYVCIVLGVVVNPGVFYMQMFKLTFRFIIEMMLNCSVRIALVFASDSLILISIINSS